MNRTLILASESPRRRELLENAGFEFHTLSSKVSEILDKNLILDEALKRLAKEKAEAVLHSIKLPNSGPFIVLAADTVVVLDGIVLGKPSDAAQAVRFLSDLSGKVHEVKTALCLWDSATHEVVTEVETSIVEFHPLSEAQIRAYVATGEPMDKAGAYAIQGGAKNFVRSLKGSLDNVVGLPVSRVERILSSHGWNISRRIVSRNSKSNSGGGSA